MVGTFLRIKCSKCNNEQTIFSKPSTVIKCVVCDTVLAEPTGGKGTLKTKVLKNL